MSNRIHPDNSREAKAQRIAEWDKAEKAFLELMNILNHEDSVSFADKANMVATYRDAYPLWAYNHLCLQDALDRQNPAYAGMDKWIIHKVEFYITQGAWIDCADNSQLREDIYLHVATQVIHKLEYSMVGKRGLIKLNDCVVYAGTIYTRDELLEHGTDMLLVKLGALPF